MDSQPRYSSYSSYLRCRYSERVYRVAVDAGFSCPNRGADRREGGCTYCGQGGSRAPYLGPAEGGSGRPGSPEALASLRSQVTRGIGFLQRRYAARRFILYFQAFSGTFAPTAALRATYDAGLAAADFCGMVVSTRPDCIDRERCDLLAEYERPDREVWVELGLQSASERTLRRLGRGHGVQAFVDACGLLRERGLRVAPHLIFGLPGEDWDDVEATIDLVCRLRADGIKIHDLHIPRGSPLLAEARAGEVPLYCPERHLEYVIRALERLPQSTIVLRLTCDSPAGGLALPRSPVDKATFHRRLHAEMAARDTWQGRLRGEARP